MFAVIFKSENPVWRNGKFVTSYCIVKENLPSLEEAKNARVCSGDIVVTQKSVNKGIAQGDLFGHYRNHPVKYKYGDIEICKNIAWLWDWEKSNSQSYACRLISE